MNKIQLTLNRLKAEKTLGLMTHVVVGYPSLNHTLSIVKNMTENGADLIELQIPFSDPLADGPTIMRACEKALANGTKVKDAFKIMKALSSQTNTPLIFMAYYNNIFRYGAEKFCQDAKSAGASGLIVPDMPIDEESNEHLIFFCKKNDLFNIQVISPSSTDDRLKKNAKIATGFVYCTARQGITGVRNQLDNNLDLFLKKVRQYFRIPVAVGFGISKKEHIQQLSNKADIAVVGSAIIELINNSSENKLKENMADFLNELKM